MRMRDDTSSSRKVSNLCCHLSLVTIASSDEARCLSRALRRSQLLNGMELEKLQMNAGSFK
jgi:hypothetical protein